MTKNKIEFRKQQIQVLSEYSKTDVAQEEARSLYQKLFQSDEFKAADSIGVTISMGFEMDTKPIIKKCLELNKSVYIPKTDSETKSMVFVKFNNYESLKLTKFGVLEPVNADDTLNPPELVIVPGLAYNKDNYRVGFGAGFYDRYLSKYKPKTVSLANTKQINTKNSWYVEEYDVPVNKIISVK